MPMGLFILKRLGIMVLTALFMTLIVFFLTNLQPNLEKLAKTQLGARITDAEVQSWLDRNGYTQPMLSRYGQWLGLIPGFVNEAADGTITGRCIAGGIEAAAAPRFCGVIQGNWGYSTKFRVPVAEVIGERLVRTGILMFWVMVIMVPTALLIGVLAGMREGSKLDRTLSVASIASTATPEYVSGVIFVAVFASWLGLLNGSAATALTRGYSFSNFTLPVMTLAIYGIGYIARMTRASMAEVMTAQYIRTARLKGLTFRSVVVRHALRNALIAPFTVIMLQFPWLLTGVVVVETMFNYKGFGYLLVQAAANNDIDLVLSCGLISVIIVLVTQLISDIGYAFLNPRIRVS
jgi:peptide/nickel transport system permease protein